MSKQLNIGKSNTNRLMNNKEKRQEVPLAWKLGTLFKVARSPDPALTLLMPVYSTSLGFTSTQRQRWIFHGREKQQTHHCQLYPSIDRFTQTGHCAVILFSWPSAQSRLKSILVPAVFQAGNFLLQAKPFKRGLREHLCSRAVTSCQDWAGMTTSELL